MTDEQIQNWRKILCGMLGPYAIIMPKEQIEKFRDKMQSWADFEGAKRTTYECEECHTQFKGSELMLLEVNMNDPNDVIPGVTPIKVEDKTYYQVCPKCKGIFES